MEVVHKKLNDRVTHSFINKLLPVLIAFNVIIYAFEAAAVAAPSFGAVYYTFYAVELFIYGIFSTLYGYIILQWLRKSSVTGKTEMVISDAIFEI